MNTSMFLPQVAQEDVYDEAGEQLDDINSVVELILVKLGVDKTADDEDDDNGQHLRRASFVDCVTPPSPQVLQIATTGFSNQFLESTSPSVMNPSLDIIIPPPKSA